VGNAELSQVAPGDADPRGGARLGYRGQQYAEQHRDDGDDDQKFDDREGRSIPSQHASGVPRNPATVAHNAKRLTAPPRSY